MTTKLNQVVPASTTFPDQLVEGGLKGRKIDVSEAAGLLQAHRACEYPLGHRIVDQAEAKLPEQGDGFRIVLDYLEPFCPSPIATRACPVDCIHPKKDEGDFEGAPQLYIDPQECIDCGACVPVCPVPAIFALDDLPTQWSQFAQINQEHYRKAPAH